MNGLLLRKSFAVLKEDLHAAWQTLSRTCKLVANVILTLEISVLKGWSLVIKLWEIMDSLLGSLKFGCYVVSNVRNRDSTYFRLKLKKISKFCRSRCNTFYNIRKKLIVAQQNETKRYKKLWKWFLD